MNRTRSILLALGLMLALAACSAATGGDATPLPDADVTVVAEDMKFDTDTLTLPAGQPFTLLLENRDGAPHNVAIYTDSSASEELYVGETVSNGAIVYEIDALEPGTYYFRCDLHPDMNGTVVVEA
ncbi:MAG TPA: cupredoxin domain-containing protein [Candidatus Limnocylindria bacterium]|nr:cupredoxin domain-containing protein [Candidatus Limnocylindria bacterium]